MRQLLLLLQLQPYLVLLHARMRAAKRTSSNSISNIISGGGYNRCALASRENGSGESLLCSLVCACSCVLL